MDGNFVLNNALHGKSSKKEKKKQSKLRLVQKVCIMILTKRITSDTTRHSQKEKP